MSNKLTVLVDMDDTIEALCDAWIGLLNERHGTNVRESDTIEWDITKAFPMLDRSDVFAPLFERELWERVKPLPGAQKYLRMLVDEGHNVFILTASHHSTIGMKVELVLNRYFPFIDSEHIITAYQKQMVIGDVLVDDAPHNLIGGVYKGIMITACHNKDFDCNAHGILRANNWYDVYQIIQQMTETEE